MRKSLVGLIEILDLPVECFDSAAGFLAGFDGKRPGCLLLDVRLPGMSGIDLHRKLVRDGVRLPTIFLTGAASPELYVYARQDTVVTVLEKPYPPKRLVEAVREALRLTATPG